MIEKCYNKPYNKALRDGNLKGLLAKPTIRELVMAESNCTARSKKLQRVKDTATFAEKAKSVHGEIFCYKKVKYENTLTKVCIVCPKHGEFWQKPKKHLEGRGCRYCSSMTPKSVHDFIKEAKHIHKGFYSYDKSNYINSNTKVVITCIKHGDFSQRPDDHLSGQGCRECYRERAGNSHRLTIEEFIARAIKKHKGFYSYERAVYVNAASKVVITCPEHGDFKQTPNQHANKGDGCPKCRPKGWHRSGFVEACNNNQGWGCLYAIECSNGLEFFYKIGITSKDLSLRFSGDSRMPYRYKVLFEIKGKPDFIYNLETKLHRMLKADRYSPSVSFSGETECFTTIKPIDSLLRELSFTGQSQLDS